MHGSDDQLSRDIGDHGEEFPQVIHIQLCRRIVKHQTSSRRPVRYPHCQLRQDKGSGQHLLLAARNAIASGFPIDQERQIGAMRADLRRLEA
jgi:hypothetical protein